MVRDKDCERTNEVVDALKHLGRTDLLKALEDVRLEVFNEESYHLPDMSLPNAKDLS